MAYDEGLAQRIRESLRGQAGITEKKMFGGVAFMREGHMFAGVAGDSLMARVRAAEELRRWVADCASFAATLPPKAKLSKCCRAARRLLTESA